MRAGGRSHKRTRARILSRIESGYYFTPDVALKTAERILREHPDLFDGAGPAHGPMHGRKGIV